MNSFCCWFLWILPNFSIRLYTYHTSIIQSIIVLSCVPFFVAQGLPNLGMEPTSLALLTLQVDSLLLCHVGSPKYYHYLGKFPVLDTFISTTKPSEIIFFICVVFHCLECHVADMTYTQCRTMRRSFQIGFIHLVTHI